MINKLDEIILKLTKNFNIVFDDFKGIYLFGVHTDGNLHEDEDIELVALFDIEDKSKREQIWPIIGKLETELGICIDLYPITQAQFEADEELFEQVNENNVFYNKSGQKETK
ncbi:MAG: nucleotidyltransferase domain-containing protein [Candidatus Gastranaerophilales bacterium]